MIDQPLYKAGPFAGDDVTDTFAFGFKVFVAGDVVVTHTDDTDTETVLVLDTGYTVTLNADQNVNPGGDVVLIGGALASGEKITITADIPALQELDTNALGGTDPGVLETAFDRAIARTAQHDEQLARAVCVPVSSADTPGEYYATIVTASAAVVASAAAAATSEANAGNSETAAAGSATAAAGSATAAAGSAAAAAGSATAAQTAETNAETALTDALAIYGSIAEVEAAAAAAASSATAAQTAETNAQTAETAAAGSASTASTAATNASNSATAAATSEANAGNSETAAAGSATAAAGSATAAASSATAAAGSASTASTAATNASNSATAAQTAETNAETAQAAAELALAEGFKYKGAWAAGTYYTGETVEHPTGSTQYWFVIDPVSTVAEPELGSGDWKPLFGWLPEATQAEMEAGTEVETRSMSPAGVAQAIAALAPQELSYFTEFYDAANDVLLLDSGVTPVVAAGFNLPRGTAIVLQEPDGTAAGGYPRGIAAVDLQTTRSAASAVASGDYAFAQGAENTASGYASFAQGEGNTASDYASFAQGAGNTASGYASFVTGAYATARGIHCARAARGGWGWRHQYERHGLSAFTADATPAQLLTMLEETPGATSTIALTDDYSAMSFEGRILAKEWTTGKCKAWKITGLIKRESGVGSVALIGTVTPEVIAADTETSGWSIAVSANTTIGCLDVTVTGAAATSIAWGGTVEGEYLPYFA